MPQYKVVELREGMMGGKMSGDKLEKVLNEHGAQGVDAQGDHLRGRQGPDRARRGRGPARHLRAPLTRARHPSSGQGPGRGAGRLPASVPGPTTAR